MAPSLKSSKHNSLLPTATLSTDGYSRVSYIPYTNVQISTRQGISNVKQNDEVAFFCVGVGVLFVVFAVFVVVVVYVFFDVAFWQFVFVFVFDAVLWKTHQKNQKGISQNARNPYSCNNVTVP